MKTTIHGFDWFKYVEVWKVVEFKNGNVFKTENTGKCVTIEDAKNLEVPYIFANLSVPKELDKELTIDLVFAENFQ